MYIMPIPALPLYYRGYDIRWTLNRRVDLRAGLKRYYFTKNNKEV